MNEIAQFEELLYSTTEYSDTTRNDSNEIERKEKGRIVTWSDICVARKFRKLDGTFYGRVSRPQKV